MIAAVTGAGGFIGRALVAELISRGHEARALLRRGNDVRLAGASTHAIGLDDRARVRDALRGSDVVFHLAASLTGAPADLFRNAVVSTRNLLDAVSDLGTPPRVVLVSSFSVYGTAGLQRVLDERTPIEAHPELRDPYAQAKIRQERLAWDYYDAGRIHLAVVRPGVVYGPGRPPLSPRVGLTVSGMLLLMGGDNLVPVTQVNNCAAAVARVGLAQATEGWAFNVCDDDLPSARDIAARARRANALRVVPVPLFVTRTLAEAAAACQRRSGGEVTFPLTPYRVASLYAALRYDNHRIKSLGWRPRISTRAGLEAAFAA